MDFMNIIQFGQNGFMYLRYSLNDEGNYFGIFTVTFKGLGLYILHSHPSV